MRFGINLRGDLAKLDDTEIAARYEQLLVEKEKMIREMPAYARYRLFRWIGAVTLGRGPLHAPIFYKIQGILMGAALALNQNTLIHSDDFKQYLLNCEFKDVRDEIKRRVRWRKLSVARS